MSLIKTKFYIFLRTKQNIASLKKILELHPLDAGLWRDVGMLYYELDKFSKSIRAETITITSFYALPAHIML